MRRGLQWGLAATNSEQMLRQARAGASDRRLRLLVCGLARALWHLLPDERSRRAVETAEAFADDAKSGATLALAEADARLAHDRLTDAFIAARRTTRGKYRRHVQEAAGLADVAGAAAWAAAPDPLGFLCVTTDCGGDELAFYDSEGAVRTLLQGHASLVRELFLNPFRPAPAVDPVWLAWRGGVVRELARATYEERRLPEGTLETVRLAELASVLEAAGCTDAELLGHLRSPGPHVRGCWALDAVSRKL